MVRRLVAEILAGMIVVVGFNGCSHNDAINDRGKLKQNIKIEVKKGSKNNQEGELIQPDLLIEDLKFMYEEYMSKNLASEEDEEIIAEFIEKYEELVGSIKEPMTLEEFYFEVAKLAAVTNNAHATVGYNGENEFLPYGFKWIEEGLVVTSSKDDILEVGDKIIQIAGKETDDYLSMLEEIISSENQYWVRKVGAKKLVQRGILEYFSSVKEDGTVKVLVEKLNGDSIDVELSFEVRADRFSPRDMEKGAKKQVKNGRGNKKSKISYEILEAYGTGILKVESCFFDEAAGKVIREFFNGVKENDISEIVLDLRDNPGGPTKVIDEFLKYIDVNEVQYWKNTEIDFGIKTIEHYSEDLFNGDIYVVTSNGTFSAGHMFAATLKYNNLATTIGEPTGQSDKFYGRSGQSTLPNSKITIGTTTVTVYMQNEEYPETLVPDIFIPLTIEDIVEDRDPIKEWIKSK